MAVSERAALRAVPVPDAAFWASAGVDLRAEGIEPAQSPNRAEAIVAPATIPPELATAFGELALRVAGPLRVLAAPDLGGVPAAEAIRARGEEDEHEDHPEDGEHDGTGHDHGHGGDDHGGHDMMMAVTGEPSTDGLVMEDIDTAIGPLSAALPSGLVLEVALDGDVVCRCEARATLTAPPILGVPDPLARAAWNWAHRRLDRARGIPASDVPALLAATEIERAVSHLAWLESFGRLLGWPDLAERASRALTPLIAAHRDLALADPGARPAPLPSRARIRLGDLRRLASGRRLARKVRALGAVDAERCRSERIAGPNARAAGVGEDLRCEDPAYGELGFEPVALETGDAEARTLVRLQEAAASVELANAALAAGELPSARGPVEGPRGPVAVTRDGRPKRLPHSRAARALAGEMAKDHELARALVVVASFDLSPWEVGG